MPTFVDVDPRELRVPSYRLQQQIARFGASTAGMPTIWVTESTDGVFVIQNGVTRATRIAKLSPKIGDFLP